MVAVTRAFDGNIGESESEVDMYLASALADVNNEVKKGLGKFGRSHFAIVPAPPVGRVNA